MLYVDIDFCKTIFYHFTSSSLFVLRGVVEELIDENCLNYYVISVLILSPVPPFQLLNLNFFSGASTRLIFQIAIDFFFTCFVK